MQFINNLKHKLRLYFSKCVKKDTKYIYKMGENNCMTE